MKHRQRILLDVERGRIARFVRNSEAGWLLYAPGREAVTIDAHEAVGIERRLTIDLDRFATDAGKIQPRVMVAALLAALWIGAVRATAPQLSGLAFKAAAAALVGYVLWEGTTDLRYRLRRRAWLRAEADRRIDRPPVPDAVARHHRRTNIFGAASGLLMTAGIVRAGWCTLASDDMLALLDPWAGAMFAVGLLLSLPARRVDRNQRRTRWSGLAPLGKR